MVLESNRDLVLRRLVECLGRDRTRHQVAEVTSLGLVQMTRKRIGTGLLESFSHDCPSCHGRGVVIEDEPVEPKRPEEESKRARRSRSRSRSSETSGEQPRATAPSPKDFAAMARHHADHEADQDADHETDQTVDHAPGGDAEQVEAEQVEAEPFVETDAAVDDEAVTEYEPLTEEPAATPESDADQEHEVPEPPDVPDVPAEPERPKVVTRSRRRAASRPAGPPTATASESPTVDGHQADQDAVKDASAAESAPSLHVPVKRKGSRKR
jgi:ribonuclease E